MSKRARRNAAADRHQQRLTASTNAPVAKPKAGRTRAYRAPRDLSEAGGWFPMTGAEGRVPTALSTIRGRARDLVHNNVYASSAVRVLTAHTVGRGIRVSLEGESDFERAWRRWSRSRSCDLEGRRNLYALQSLAVRTMFEAGDAFIVMRDRVNSVTGELELKLQVLDPDQLAPAVSPQIRGNTVQAGVEIYPSGQVAGYHFLESLDNSTRSFFAPVRDVLHFLELLYPGQLRGIPRGSQALVRAHGVDKLWIAIHARAVAESCMVGVRKRTHTSSDAIIGAEVDDEEPPEFGYSSEKLTPGAILELEPGEDFSFSSPPSSGGLADYLRIGLQAIASGYRVMYDQISQDLSQTSYSGFKAGRLDFYADVDATREHVLYPELEKLVRRFMSVYEANTGETVSDIDFSFVAPAREQLEPVKETNALMSQRKLGLKSFADVALAAGHDPDEQAARLAQDYVVLARHGLTLDPATGAVVPVTPPATQDHNEPDPAEG